MVSSLASGGSVSMPCATRADAVVSSASLVAPMIGYWRCSPSCSVPLADGGRAPNVLADDEAGQIGHEASPYVMP